MNYVLCFSGLAVGNFIGAAIFSYDFGAAIDRSFFQGVALACYALMWGSK